jgi:hypothetical protein
MREAIRMVKVKTPKQKDARALSRSGEVSINNAGFDRLSNFRHAQVATHRDVDSKVFGPGHELVELRVLARRRAEGRRESAEAKAAS